MQPEHPRPLQWSIILLCLALFGTAVVYWPGLSGEFQFDDQPNIIDNPAVALDTLSWSNLREASFSGMGVSMGDLIEYGVTETLFTNPVVERTESYITGRFG